MITSVRNAKIKWVRGLQGRARTRREEGAFVIEGVRLAEEALQAGWRPRLVLYTEDLSARGREAVRGFQDLGAEALAVTPEVMVASSDTRTPQGILVVLSGRAPSLPANPDFLLILDEVRDPGNLGATLRTAAAAGVDAAFLAPGTVDPYAPKVLRAGMGAHFRLPVMRLDWGAIESYLGQIDPPPRVYLADSGAGDPYMKVDLRRSLALIVGGEAEGAGETAHHLAQSRVHIPMPGRMDSLNAAIAAAILLFEVVRQRTSPD
jgi:TrmH family RNA methyltransferase